MANNLVENLGKELEQIDREYASDFAGHSRLTRDIGQMERMIKKCASIVEQVDKIPSAAQGPDLARVRDAAQQSLQLYQAEREAIARAQEVGPSFESFSMEATSANFVFARYMRHFAGKDRSTRDVALLGEMVEDLRQIEKRMSQLLTETKGSADFEKDRKVVRENLAQYQKEIELVEGAQIEWHARGPGERPRHAREQPVLRLPDALRRRAARLAPSRAPHARGRHAEEDPRAHDRSSATAA